MTMQLNRPVRREGLAMGLANRVAQRALRWLFLLLVASIFAFLVAPIGFVIQQSFNGAGYLSYPLQGVSLRWYHQFFSNPAWVNSARTGLLVGVLAAGVSTALGTMAAWSLSRLTFKGKDLIYSLMFSPLVAPVIILAIAFYLFFGEMKWVGNLYAIVMAYGVLGLPYVLVTVSTALVHFDPAQEQAGATLGAAPWRVLWYITMPQISSAIFAGGLFAFVMAFDEVILISFLGGGRVITLARQMWNSLRYDLNPTLAVAGTILIAISFTLFAAAELATYLRERRRQG